MDVEMAAWGMDVDVGGALDADALFGVDVDAPSLVGSSA